MSGALRGPDPPPTAACAGPTAPIRSLRVGAVHLRSGGGKVGAGEPAGPGGMRPPRRVSWTCRHECASSPVPRGRRRRHRQDCQPSGRRARLGARPQSLARPRPQAGRRGDDHGLRRVGRRGRVALAGRLRRHRGGDGSATPPSGPSGRSAGGCAGRDLRASRQPVGPGPDSHTPVRGAGGAGPVLHAAATRRRGGAGRPGAAGGSGAGALRRHGTAGCAGGSLRRRPDS